MSLTHGRSASLCRVHVGDHDYDTGSVKSPPSAAIPSDSLEGASLP